MRLRFALPLVAALTFLAACRDARVESYRTPHEQPDPLPPVLTGGLPPASPANGAAEPGSGMAATAVPTASGEGLTWQAPAHWQAKPASAMRKGSYAIPGENGAAADLSITAFPGDVGGELANLNRWRGQLELPPLAPAEAAAVTTRFEQNGLSFVVVDFVNAKPDASQRILGALVPFDGATWFVKLMGPDAVVAHEKAAFLDFLKTVKPAAGSTP